MENKWFIVRGDRSGVFFGHIAERNGREVKMTDVRGLWYWDGAAALPQLALEGTKRPRNCKFTATVAEIEILDAIEILPCTDAAAGSICGVPEWKM